MVSCGLLFIKDVVIEDKGLYDYQPYERTEPFVGLNVQYCAVSCPKKTKHTGKYITLNNYRDAIALLRGGVGKSADTAFACVAEGL